MLTRTPRPVMRIGFVVKKAPRWRACRFPTPRRRSITCNAFATAPTLAPFSPCKPERRRSGPCIADRDSDAAPRCSRTSSMRVEMVKSIVDERAEPRSDPLQAGRPARDRRAERKTPARSVVSRAAGRRASLETDISGVAQELGLHRNMQTVVYGIVELPEADHGRRVRRSAAALGVLPAAAESRRAPRSVSEADRT